MVISQSGLGAFLAFTARRRLASCLLTPQPAMSDFPSVFVTTTDLQCLECGESNSSNVAMVVESKDRLPLYGNEADTARKLVPSYMNDVSDSGAA